MLEREGEVVTVEAVDDHWGIGKDAVKTTELLSRRASARPLGRLSAVRGSDSGGERADDDPP